MNKKSHKTLKKLDLTEEERESIRKQERREFILDTIVLALALLAAIIATLIVMGTAP